MSERKKYRLLNFSLKILLSVVLIYVIYSQLDSKDFEATVWQTFFSSRSFSALLLLALVVFLMPLNLFFEVKKWHLLVNIFEKHGFRDSVRDILSGITGGLVTPAALGDYAGRVLRVDPEHSWKGVWSNFVNSLSQNIIVIFSGLAGSMVLILNRFELDQRVWHISLAAGTLLAVFFILLFFNLQWLKPLFRFLAGKTGKIKVFRSFDVVDNISRKLSLQILTLSFLRYSVFVFQYFLLLRFWEIEGQVVLLISAISTIYMVQTVLAVPPVLYWLIRGELALLLLGHFTENGAFILAATFMLWAINQAIPALAGWIILMNTNFSRSLGYERN